MRDTIFTCPRCGGHHYGSFLNGMVMFGHCHGDNCKFTWPRIDDAKYFAKRTTTPELPPEPRMFAIGATFGDLFISQYHAEHDSQTGFFSELQALMRKHKVHKIDAHWRGKF